MLRFWSRLIIMDTFLLTLVRHGETAENKLKIVQGHTDTKLVEIGVRQATLLGHRLKNETFTHVFSSDLSRALKTCELIMNLNKGNSAHIISDSRLRERKLGVLEGQSHSSCSNMIKAKFPGIETKLEVRERAKSFFKELCRTICKGSLNPNDKTSKKYSFQYPCKNPECRNCSHPSTAPLVISQQAEDTSGLDYLCNVNDAKAETSNHLKNAAAAAKLESSPDIMKLSLESSSDEEHLGITPDVLQFGMKLNLEKQTSDCPTADDFDSSGVTDDHCSALNQTSVSRSSTAEGHGNEVGAEGGPSILTYDNHCHLANVLLVSHGGFLVELINYFSKELKCNGLNESTIEAAPGIVSGSETPRSSIMSNAGLSRFSIAVNRELGKPTQISCLYLNDRKHLLGDEAGNSVSSSSSSTGVSDLVC